MSVLLYWVLSMRLLTFPPLRHTVMEQWKMEYTSTPWAAPASSCGAAKSLYNYEARIEIISLAPGSHKSSRADAATARSQPTFKRCFRERCMTKVLESTHPRTHAEFRIPCSQRENSTGSYRGPYGKWGAYGMRLHPGVYTPLFYDFLSCISRISCDLLTTQQRSNPFKR